jgi:uncharacterized membrane protein
VTGPVSALALTSALCSASATVFIRRGLSGGDTNTGFWINVAVGTVAIWIAVLVVGPGPVHLSSLAFFAVSGLVGTVAGRLFRFLSIRQVGAGVSAAITSQSPFVSTILSILLLGERVTMPIAIGTVVIVAGTVLLSASGKLVGFRPVLLVVPFLSATCFGVVAILRKLGLGGASAVQGFAVNVTTAFVAFSLYLAIARRGEARVCTPRSAAWFVAAGLAENAGVFLGVLALKLGAVRVVTPLTATAPIFVLLMAPVLLPGIERVTARVVVGACLIVAGIYLITAL